MTDDEWRAEILAREAFIRTVGFCCPADCPDDYYAHAEAAITALCEPVHAALYGVAYEPQPTGNAHLDQNIARIIALWEAKRLTTA